MTPSTEESGLATHRPRIALALAGLAEYVAGYTVVNYLSVGRPAWELGTWIDDAVPLVVPWVYVYSLAYPTVFTPAIFVRDMARLRTTFCAFTLAVLLSSTTFLLFPVIMHRPPVPAAETGSWLLALTYRIDPPYNCFPSLHVGIDALAAIACFGSDRIAGSIVWTLTIFISISTLFVKQHYLLDVVGGLVLAVVATQLAQTRPMLRLFRGARLHREPGEIEDALTPADGRAPSGPSRP